MIAKKEREEMDKEREIIVVSRRLLEKIDRHRDDLSRAEFIELCLDSLLGGQGHAPASSRRDGGMDGEVVSREEFEEFKRGIKDLQRAYIDFLLSYTLEPSTWPGTPDRFVQEMDRLLEGGNGQKREDKRLPDEMWMQ